jgi:phosphinothricin acetyltransferase
MERVLAARVRPARPSDLDGVDEVYNHYIVNSVTTFDMTPMNADERKEWFNAHSAGGRHRLVVGVDLEERVVGWATTSPFRPRPAYGTTVESSVYCRPECRGAGLGSALYRYLFASIAEEDIERIVAGVALPNPASVRLHERFGFRPVGTFTSVGRKFGQFWDVRWFERPRLLPARSGGLPQTRPPADSGGMASLPPFPLQPSPWAPGGAQRPSDASPG